MKMLVRHVGWCLLLVNLFLGNHTLYAQISQPQNNPTGTSQPSPAGQPPQKELPWKSVAAPQGILSMSTYGDKIRQFGDRDKFAETKRFIEENLLKATVGSVQPAALGQKDLYVAIHVVDYGEPGVKGVPVKSNIWYLYRKDTSFEHFTGQRIYGSRNVVVLFLHLNAKGVESLTEPQRTALLTDQLEDAANKLKLRSIQNGAVDSLFADVHYEAAVVKKTPANIQNLFSVLKILGLVSEAEELRLTSITTVPIILWGSGTIQNISVPSDITVAGYNTSIDSPPMATSDRGALQLGTNVGFNDEGRYLWDVSIGIPVHKIKQVQYSSSNNTVEARQIDKQSAYAMFDLMVRPVDLEDPKSNLMPRLLLGFPLSSDPWDKLFAGGGVGVPKLMLGNQLFVGVVFNRVSKPTTLAPGSNATTAQLQTDSRLQLEYKLVVGLNVPVKSVFDKLTRK